MQVEKTQIINVDDRNFLVRDLPPNVQRSVELFDAIRQRQMDITVELEMATAAVNVYTVKLQEVVRQLSAGAAKVEASKKEGASAANE